MSLIETFRKEEKALLQLDSGDLFLKPPNGSPDPKGIRRNAELIARAYKALSMDAVNVGDLDLQMGLAFLQEEARRGLPLLSANLLFKKERKLVFPPYLIREVSGIRFGIFGLANSSPRVIPKEIGEEISVEEPVQSARAVLRELTGKADIVICLSDLGTRGDQILAGEVTGIHFILGGHSGEMLNDPVSIGHTRIFQHYRKGMYVGRIDLTIVGRDFQFQDGGRVERLSRDLDRLERQVRFLESRKKSSPAFEAQIKGLQDQKAEMEKSLKEAKASPVKGSHFLHRSIPLGRNIPDHRDWKAILQSVEGTGNPGK